MEISWTCKKVSKSVVLVYSQNCATVITINFRTFSPHRNETLYRLASPPDPLTPSPAPALGNRLPIFHFYRFGYSGHFM